jgi:hypothetical protein
LAQGDRDVTEKLGAQAGVSEARPAALNIEWWYQKEGTNSKAVVQIFGVGRWGCSRTAGCTRSVVEACPAALNTEWVV